MIFLYFFIYYFFYFFFFKQKTAYEMRISDWSSDVCSSDLDVVGSLIEASEWISQNQNETANILNKYYRLPKKDAMNQLQGLTFNMNMHKLPVIKDFERLAEFSLRHKLIKNVPA